MEISPNVHLIPDVIANPYLVLDSDGVTLIDTGLPGSHNKILKYLTALGHSARDLSRIIITHADTDHVGALASMKRLTGARVYASAIEAAAIARGESSRPARPHQLVRRAMQLITRRLLKAGALQADEMISEGQVLPVLGGLRVVETPGHTPGHISLFSPSAGVLFTGDSIISRDGVLVPSLPGFTWDSEKAAASVRRQAALNPRIVCPGHGPPVTDAAGKMPSI